MDSIKVDTAPPDCYFLDNEEKESDKKIEQEVAHLRQELEEWKQRCEELEIELECMRHAFPEDDHDVLPNRRGIF